MTLCDYSQFCVDEITKNTYKIWNLDEIVKFWMYGTHLLEKLWNHLDMDLSLQSWL